MSEQNQQPPQDSGTLSVEELEDVAGGAISGPNTNCGDNCHC